MQEIEYRFCMKQFKPAIVVLSGLVIIVLAWSGWNASQRRVRALHLSLAAASVPAAAFAPAAFAPTTTKPPAKKINVKDKMLHPYWGNCNKCHITVDAGKPVSNVMASVPISVKDKMVHKFWGNCLLCHKVVDGFQPDLKPLTAKAAALTRLSALSVGLKIQSVTGATMRKLGLVSEDGALVLEVAPGSIAASAGIQKGDEIIRVGNARIDSVNTFEAALNGFKPGNNVKLNIYHGKKSRNIFLRIPDNFSGDINPAAAAVPLPQSRVQPLAGQFGVPNRRQYTVQGRVGVNLNYGKVAVAAEGPGLGYGISRLFGVSPYFIIYDPAQNTYKVAANPNANDATGRGIQTGQYVVDLGVNNVIAGNFGPRALQTLRTLRINVFPGATGTVRDVLSSYRAGNLAAMTSDPTLRAALPGGSNTSPGTGGQRVQPIY